MKYKVKVKQGISSDGGMLAFWRCPKCKEGNLNNNFKFGCECAFCKQSYQLIKEKLKNSSLVSETKLLKKLCSNLD